MSSRGGENAFQGRVQCDRGAVLGRGSGCFVLTESGEHPVRDPAPQQPECLDSSLAGADLLREVDSTLATEALLGYRSHMEGGVDASIAAAREPHFHVVARPDRDGRRAVEPRERGRLLLKRLTPAVSPTIAAAPSTPMPGTARSVGYSALTIAVSCRSMAVIRWVRVMMSASRSRAISATAPSIPAIALAI